MSGSSGGVLEIAFIICKYKIGFIVRKLSVLTYGKIFKIHEVKKARWKTGVYHLSPFHGVKGGN